MHYFRNYSFAHFEANFPEKPCSRIGQILHFKMVVWALWVRCGVLGNLSGSPRETQRFYGLWRHATRGAGPMSQWSCGKSVHPEPPSIILGSLLILGGVWTPPYRERS